MKLKDKANFQFCGQAEKILENANYHFLASVALTKEKQAFQMREDFDLLGEVGCPGSTQFCSTCAAVHRAEELQQAHPAALPHCSPTSSRQTAVSRKSGRARSTGSIGLSALHSLSRSFGRTGEFSKSHIFLQNAVLLSSVTINFFLFVQELAFLFQLLPTVAESALQSTIFQRGALPLTAVLEVT